MVVVVVVCHSVINIQIGTSACDECNCGCLSVCDHCLFFGGELGAPGVASASRVEDFVVDALVEW